MLSRLKKAFRGETETDRLIRLEESAWNGFCGFLLDQFHHLRTLNRFELTTRKVNNWLNYSYNALVNIGRKNYGPHDHETDQRDPYTEGIEESPRDKNVYRSHTYQKYKEVMDYIDRETWSCIILVEMYHAELEGRLHKKWDEKLKALNTKKESESFERNGGK